MTEIVDIERMSYGPDAVGHLSSGKAVFVRGGVPGRTAEVRITDERPRYATGVAVGAEVDPLAPWALLSYEEQLRAKEANVRDALVRNGHMDADAVDAALRPIVPAKDEWGYRNKLEMAATRDERGRFALGFHDGALDQVAPIERCRLGNRLIADAPRSIAGALRYLAGSEDLGVYRVGIRGSLSTKSVEVALWTPPGAFPRGFAAKMLHDAVGATSVVRVIAEAGSARSVRQVEVLDGDGFWAENLMFGEPPAPLRFRISAPSFFQVNTKQAAKLVRLALEGIEPEPGQRVADLYSGAGTFSIPLAKRGATVTAIELEGSAARDLRRNRDLNAVNVAVTCDDVARALPALADQGMDALLVDPPRAGLDKRVIKYIAKATPKRIVYVSCDPQTFARDAARLRQVNYTLATITPVDLFPQTYHTETVAIFQQG